MSEGAGVIEVACMAIFCFSLQNCLSIAVLAEAFQDFVRFYRGGTLRFGPSWATSYIKLRRNST